mmetsp:Transcript_64969/g.174421  ORF Transcript_64969/g.174421 Transcript_64969/m.174421 type:complete len:227 (+) Transcript_64969:188-868(+)
MQRHCRCSSQGPLPMRGGEWAPVSAPRSISPVGEGRGLELACREVDARAAVDRQPDAAMPRRLAARVETSDHGGPKVESNGVPMVVVEDVPQNLPADAALVVVRANKVQLHSFLRRLDPFYRRSKVAVHLRVAVVEMYHVDARPGQHKGDHARGRVLRAHVAPATPRHAAALRLKHAHAVGIRGHLEWVAVQDVELLGHSDYVVGATLCIVRHNLLAVDKNRHPVQ